LVTGYYAAPGPNHIAGKVGAGAVYLNGLGNYGLGDYLVTTTSASQLDVGANSFTLAFWLKTTTHTDAILLNKYSSAGMESGYLLAVDGASNGGKLRLQISDGAGGVGRRVFKGATPLNDGAWHHIAVVVDRAGVLTSFYVDGALSSSSGANNSGNLYAAVLFAVGRANSVYGGWLAGAMDELRVYSRALSVAEVASLASVSGPLYRLEPVGNVSPRVTGVRLSGPDVIVSFTSAPGQRYDVLRADALAGGAWQVVAAGLAGTGQTLQVTDTNGAAFAGRFYRVRIAP